jgi:prepilin-type N-terminal cleavage/methylation domain-containing protein
MRLRPHVAVTGRNCHHGFSAIELTISMTVILLLAGIASPVLMRSLRLYQLNDSATQLAGLVKLTRFEAIRKNTRVSCGFQQNETTWTVWKDTISNGKPDPQETQLVLGSYADLLPASKVPDATAISNTIGGGGTLAWNVVSGANGSIRFDARGAVDFGGNPWAVYVFFLGNSTDKSAGYRAVLVFPAGTTQVWAWTATGAGDWHRTS